jgi:hypothetical protein
MSFDASEQMEIASGNRSKGKGAFMHKGGEMKTIKSNSLNFVFPSPNSIQWFMMQNQIEMILGFSAPQRVYFKFK